MSIVSALVCTRNRPKSIVGAARSLLSGRDPNLELIVVDQSDGPETELALQELKADTRLRYLRSSVRRGKGVALNEGIRAARGTIIACTDDDCEAPPDWAVGMARALESQPTAAVAFCRVVPAPHDRLAGYVPAYDLKSNRLLRSVTDVCGGLGIGAGMAFRRDFAVEIGGYDESFGPGSRFWGADEWDLAIRALLVGKHVFETTEFAIVHDGFRTFAEGRLHSRHDWLGIGAVCAKPLRAGYLGAAVVPLWLFSSGALWPPIADLLRLRRPRGVGRIVGFLEGFGGGLRVPVDPKTLRYC